MEDHPGAMEDHPEDLKVPLGAFDAHLLAMTAYPSTIQGSPRAIEAHLRAK